MMEHHAGNGDDGDDGDSDDDNDDVYWNIGGGHTTWLIHATTSRQTGGQLALLIRLHHIPTFLCSTTRLAEQQAGRGHHGN